LWGEPNDDSGASFSFTIPGMSGDQPVPAAVMPT
jgi:hypothetical protein